MFGNLNLLRVKPTGNTYTAENNEEKINLYADVDAEQCRNELQSIRGWNYEKPTRFSAEMERGGPRIVSTRRKRPRS